MLLSAYPPSGHPCNDEMTECTQGDSHSSLNVVPKGSKTGGHSDRSKKVGGCDVIEL